MLHEYNAEVSIGEMDGSKVKKYLRIVLKYSSSQTFQVETREIRVSRLPGTQMNEIAGQNS